MSIFKNSLYAARLQAYYQTHYGETNTDRWYDQPAVNVWVFGREGRVITLKSDVRTGAVTEQVEFLPK